VCSEDVAEVGGAWKVGVAVEFGEERSLGTRGGVVAPGPCCILLDYRAVVAVLDRDRESCRDEYRRVGE